MAVRPDWTMGTITLVAGSKDFVTTGSALLAAGIQAGDAIITASGAVLIIADITGENSGKLYEPCPAGSAGIEQPLRIRFQPDGSRYAAAARDLVQQLSSGNLHSLSQLQGDVDKVPYFIAPGVLGLIDLVSLGGGGDGAGTWDVLVGTLAGRDAFDSEVEGFRVLVADNGSGQAVIFEKTASGWSVPVPFTGPRGNDGQTNTLSVGTVTEGEQAHVSITGTAPNQIVNFVLRRGEKGDMGDVTPEALAALAAAEAFAAQTAGDRIATGEDRVAVAADKAATSDGRQATAADRVATGQDTVATAADRIATGQDRAATSADASATAADRIAAADDAAIASAKAIEATNNAALTAADRIATGQDAVATAADRVATGQDRAAAHQSAVNAAASESSVAADALAAANSAAEGLVHKQDAQAAAMVSDARATDAEAAAVIVVAEAGNVADAAAHVAADRLAVAEDKVAVASDRAAGEVASSAAIAASDKAQDWANAPEGQEVEPGEYSARHYAKMAETAAGGGVQMVNGKTGAEITLEAADVGAATEAQGALADTAVQPDAIEDFVTSAQLSQDLAGKFDKPVGTTSQYLDGRGAPQVFPTIPSTASDVGAVPDTKTAAIDANTAARHDHGNKAILDGTQQSFTTALKDKVDGIEEGAQVNPNMALYQAVNQKNQNNGYAGLGADGKLDQSQLPAIAIIDTFPVANQAAMLALTAQKGDMAIRSDVNKTFVLRVEPASVLANWSEMLAPASGVQSVAVAVPAGFSVSGAITTTGTITISYANGYQGFTTAEANKLAGIASGADKTPALAAVATTGSYNNLSDRPFLGSASSQDASAFATAAQFAALSTGKQDSLGFTPVNKAGDVGLGGYSATPAAVTGSTTLGQSTGNYRQITNNGAVTITAPSGTGGDSYFIVLTNGASAGAVTFSGFTAVKGDDLNTTNGRKFFISVARINADAIATIAEQD